MNTIKKHIFTVLSLFFVLPLVCACVGGQSSSGSSKAADPAVAESGADALQLASLEDMVVGIPLTMKYNTVIIGDFTSSAQVKTDYPKAAAECEEQMINQLKSKNSYKNVTDDKTKKFSGKTAVVDVEVVDMRIAGNAARMWGGVFAGSSFMNVKVVVRNAGAKEIIHQRELATSNNAWAAAYSFKSTDQSLPSDFGVLVGEYLSKIIPAK